MAGSLLEHKRRVATLKYTDVSEVFGVYIKKTIALMCTALAW
jgi:hypothetical protein